MFKGLSAWFSGSVSRKVKKVWVDNGGKVTLVGEAQFIFSEDTEASDTRSVFESEAYLEEHLAVFHPNYIKECVKHGNVEQVTLGKYFFPPGDVQAIAREQLQYQWDLDGNTSDGDSINYSDEEEPAPPVREIKKAKHHRKGSLDHSAQQPSTSKHLSMQVQTNKSDKEPTRGKGSNAVKIQGSQSPEEIVRSDRHKELGRKFNQNTDGDSQGFILSDSPKEPERKSPRRSSRLMSHTAQSKSDAQHCNSTVHPDSSHKLTLAEKQVTSSSQNRSITSQSNAKPVNDINIGEHGVKTATGSESKARKRKRNENCTAKEGDTEDKELMRLEEMAKVTGDLQDFVVGENGCELVKVS